MSFLSSSLSSSMLLPSKPKPVSSAKTCLFCPKLGSISQTYLMLNKALFLKYSSSQNYYYTKDIQDLIDNARLPHVIEFKDRTMLSESEEYLTRLYKSAEHKPKLLYLTEYYKYHREVPRLFMHPSSTALNHYHDRKRRLEYYRIKRMLAQQKKGVIVAGGDKIEYSSDSQERSQSRQGTQGQVEGNEKPMLLSRVLQMLENSQEMDTTSRKKFTINKTIKNKGRNDGKKNKEAENSMVSLKELAGFLDKLVVRPKEGGYSEETLMNTEMSELFPDEDLKLKIKEDLGPKTVVRVPKEIKISLGGNNKVKEENNANTIRGNECRNTASSSKTDMNAVVRGTEEKNFHSKGRQDDLNMLMRGKEEKNLIRGKDDNNYVIIKGKEDNNFIKGKEDINFVIKGKEDTLIKGKEDINSLIKGKEDINFLIKGKEDFSIKGKESNHLPNKDYENIFENFLRSSKDHENNRKNSASKVVMPLKNNNFLSPKGLTTEKSRPNPVFSEKVLEKHTKTLEKPAKTVQNDKTREKSSKTLDKHSKTDFLSMKPSAQTQASIEKAGFKKKKSYSIASTKEKETKTDSIYLKKSELQPKSTKFFSPEKEKTGVLPGDRLKKVEKFIKIYKTSGSLQVQQKISKGGVSLPEHSESQVMHNNSSKISNSKSFSEKNVTKHRRINSMNPRGSNMLKKYESEVPLERVQEILYKAPLNLQNNNLSLHHRKMPSEVLFTPKDLPKPSSNRFFNAQIMSRSQVSNKIKHFNVGLSKESLFNGSGAKENQVEALKNRNKSLEGTKNLMKGVGSVSVKSSSIGNLKAKKGIRGMLNYKY